MEDYLYHLRKMIEISDGDADGMIIVNKDGMVEFFKGWKGQYAEYFNDIGKQTVGLPLLDLYPELNEENSTVIQALRTGETIVGSRQHLSFGPYRATIMSVTHPILVNRAVQGAVDVVKCIGMTLADSKEDLSSYLYEVKDIFTQNPDMQALKEAIVRVADTNSTVLICGETGTGKELVAESIHTASRRRKKPFLSQNCAAIPASLLESIFFGTEKGSFTDALSRKGLFELAEGGTLFLDEINSMDLTLQVKLLKALEEKKVRRIGGKSDIRFDVRVICATNEMPEELLNSGRLREDLYYRINVVRLWIPPLRQRREDILLLANQFIQMFNRQMNRSIQGLSSMVAEFFENWDWPGNVRELRNAVESAFNLAQSDTILIGDIQGMLRMAKWKQVNAQFKHGEEWDDEQSVALEGNGSDRTPEEPWLSRTALHGALADGGVNLQQVLEQFEAYLLRETLMQEDKLSEAARKLSISPQRLNYKLDKYGLRELKKQEK